MAGFCGRLRFLATRTAFVAVTAFALVPSADAQFLPPFGAAPPAEIVERLRAEGYVLIHPLQRRETVYLADVAGGPGRRERLVIDAWSGEILQRFLIRREGFVPEGGEFGGPPPLGPPPARDFGGGNYGYEPGGPPGGYEAPPKARARSRPAATARKGGESKPTAPAAQPAEPQNAGTGSPGAAPATAAPAGPAAPATGASPPASPGTPNAATPAKSETSPANAASEPAQEIQPKTNAAAASPAAAQSPANVAPPPGQAPANPLPASAEKKPGEKKVNDVPVNPLD